MTRGELAAVLTEIEGQRRALVEHGFERSAAYLQDTIGKLIVDHIVEVITGLRFWDAPLALTKERIEEEIHKRQPPAPSKEDIKNLQ